MNAHLSRSHNDSCRVDATEGAFFFFFTCPLCNFKQPFSEEILCGYLRGNLRSHEMVACPFKNCNDRTNSYSAFNAHKSRKHGGDSDFGECVVLADNDSAPVVVAAESLGSADTFDLDEV